MKTVPPKMHANRRAAKRRTANRRALSSLEVLVSLTLLLSVLSCSMVLIARHGRLLVAQRHYRIALDELSNQLDRITALPAADVPEAVKKVSVSHFAAERLPGAKLSGELKPADVGQRVNLRLVWKEHAEQAASLTGWVYSESR
jgi:hypothetical protein